MADPVQNSTFASVVGGAASVLLVDLASWVGQTYLHLAGPIPTVDAQAFTVLVMALLTHYVHDTASVQVAKALPPAA